MIFQIGFKMSLLAPEIQFVVANCSDVVREPFQSLPNQNRRELINKKMKLSNRKKQMAKKKSKQLLLDWRSGLEVNCSSSGLTQNHALGTWRVWVWRPAKGLVVAKICLESKGWWFLLAYASGFCLNIISTNDYKDLI